METRNIVDKYWGWTTELIQQDLIENAFPYAVLIENLHHDMNISSAIRNANIFAAKEIYYYGNKRFDRRGMVGANHYSILKHLKTMDEVIQLKQKYNFVAFDNNLPGTKTLESFIWPKNPLMVFGTECEGISKEMLSICDETVEIKQYGSVRSLNCATASGIAMHDFTRKYNNMKNTSLTKKIKNFFFKGLSL